MNLLEVNVMHSGLKTPYKLYVREDRLKAFYDSLTCFCTFEEKEDWSMGVDGAAVVGMNAIFTQIPNKFPMVDIIRFLKEDYEKTTTYKTEMAKVEHHLGDFGREYPGIAGNGEDIL